MTVLVMGCGDSASPNSPPPWLPSELADLELRLTDDSEFTLGEDEAIAIARDKFFLEQTPAVAPDAFAVLVSGPVAPQGAVPVSPSGGIERPRVEDKPAWLVVWRGIDFGMVNAPSDSGPGDVPIDLVVFVDAKTGGLLASRILAGRARLD